MIAAIVLAAGRSTRMGEENKLLLPIRGTTMIESTVRAVTGAPVGETLVVLGHDAERVRPLVERFPVRVVDNPRFAEGMGSSLKAGLRAADPAATGYMVCLTDLPLLESADFARLIGAFEAAQAGAGPEVPDGPGGGNGTGGRNGRKDILVPQFRGERGNPVLFSARYREEVLHTRGPVAGCRGIVRRYPAAVLALEMDNDHILRDIDTPEDYRRLNAGHP